MTTKDSKTSRRAFVMSGGATLGAGVAAAATVVSPGSHKPAEPMHEDREAIRQVHVKFIAGVEAGALAGAAPTHRAYRTNARQIEDTLKVNGNRRQATATWHVDVKTGMPLDGDSTIEQMARLQGMLGNVNWESGRLEARYEKAGGEWQMTSVNYTAA